MRKITLHIYLLIIFLSVLNPVFGQNFEIKATQNQNTLVFKGDTVNLEIIDARGDIQWQSSTSGVTWTSIEGETNQKLSAIIEANQFFRVQIIEAACDPVFSDTLFFMPMLLKPDALVIDSDDMELISDSLDIAKGVFKFDMHSDIDLKVGDVIVGEDGYGYLRKIESVEKDNGSIVMETSKAYVDDIVDQLDLSDSVIIRMNDGFPKQPLLNGTVINNLPVNLEYIIPGAKIKSGGNGLNLSGVKFEFSDGDHKASTIITEGEIQFSPSLRRSVRFNDELKKFFMFVDADLQFDAKAELRSDAQMTGNQLVKKLIEYEVGPANIGPVPMYIRVSIFIACSMDLAGAGYIETDFSEAYHVNYGAQIDKDADLPWSQIWTVTPELEANSPVCDSKGMRVRLFVYPEITTILAGEPGSDLNIKTDLKFDNYLTASTWYWSLFGGIEGDLFFNAENWSANMQNANFELNRREWEILSQQGTKPGVITLEASNVSTNSALLNGTLEYNGNSPIKKMGFAISTNPQPNTKDIEVDIVDGNFSFLKEGLEEGQQFFVRAYAENEFLNTWGEEVSFTTSHTLTLPEVTTAEISNITDISADGGGNVTKNGYTPITARGVCWSTSENPTLADNKTSNGTGTGEFTSALTALTENTLYYVRAYASNSVGTAYGESVSFTSEHTVVLPTITTTIISDINNNSATGGGNVTENGYAEVTGRGICWNTAGSPVITDSKTENGTGLGEFTSSLTGLNSNTVYHVRAYATNSAGTQYGSEVSFTSAEGTFTDARDGNTYNYLTLGTQVWMAENLAYLPSVSEHDEGENNLPYYYVYGYEGTDVSDAKASANYSTYGALYNWEASSYACPSGWHLPSDDEWKTLEEHLGMTSADADINGWRSSGNVGYKMKSTSGWTDNGNGSNSSGFGALPAGDRNSITGFININADAYFWTATSNNALESWYRGFHYSRNEIMRTYLENQTGFSVRCIQGDPATKPVVTTNTISNIDKTTADGGGEVTDDGGANITVRGVCWSTSEAPDVNDSKTSNGTGTGTFTSSLTSLTPDTRYYVRAYATNSEGTAYGRQVYFNTEGSDNDGSFTDSRDGNVYDYKIIGTQIWMINNLAYLPHVSDSNTGSEDSPHRYVYGYEGSSVASAKASANYSTYGVLYNWEAALIACPDGWMLPSSDQWTILKDYLGDDFAGYKMKSTTGWDNIGNGDNSSRFNALPTGERDYWGGFYGMGNRGGFWSTVPDGATQAERWYLVFNGDSLYTENIGKSYGFSVRCLAKSLPSVTTNEISNLNDVSATSGGVVTNEGVNSSVSARGVCWSTSQNPTIADPKTTNGTGSGAFTSEITGLKTKTSYYVRAYATNSNGTSYGNEVSLVTIALPTVQTSDISNIMETNADGGGEVTSTGGSQVTARGVCWSTTENPTINDDFTSDGSGRGVFSSSITGLTVYTKYYVRAYATSSVGTVYGDQKEFTSGTIKDTRDNNVYRYKTIGVQTWLIDNLAYLPSVSPPGTGSSSTQRYYVYGYNGSSVDDAKATDNYSRYGVLYNFEAVTNSLCPDGWHFPSEDEWRVLETHLGMNSNEVNDDVGERTSGEVGKQLKSATGWDNTSAGTDGNGTNSSGFSAIPAGQYYHDGSEFAGMGSWGYFWTDKEVGKASASARKLSNASVGVYRSDGSQKIALSARCIKDVSSVLPTVNTTDISNISATSAEGGGNVTDNGGAEVHRGVCWSTSENPTVDNNKTDDGVGEGVFNSTISPLSPNTTYYVRAYATNDSGTSYGEQKSFLTIGISDGTFTDSRDGKEYSYVNYGAQTWMNENLAYLPSVNLSSQVSVDNPYYYVYDYEGDEATKAKATANYKEYGALYNWEAAKISCPDGWHFPSGTEWDALVNYIGDNPSGKMKSAYGWYDDNNGSNSSGFNALPAGYCSSSGGGFSRLSKRASFWTADSNPDDATMAFTREMTYDGSTYLQTSNSSKANGNSLRCIKD